MNSIFSISIRCFKMLRETDNMGSVAGIGGRGIYILLREH
jgi:hypothetical protein